MSDTKTPAGQDADPDPDSLPTLAPGSFILVRHGQTHWNMEGRLQGHSNHRWTRLTPLGIRQAETAATMLKAAGVRHLVCSGLFRAQQTMEIIWRQTGGTLRIDEALNERRFGMLEGLTMDEVVKKVGAESRADFEQNFHRYLPPCTEGNRALLRRMVPALNKWRAVHKGEQVAFIGHKGTCRVLSEHLCGVPAFSRNGAPLRFACADGVRWTIDELGRGD